MYHLPLGAEYGVIAAENYDCGGRNISNRIKQVENLRGNLSMIALNDEVMGTPSIRGMRATVGHI
jgi:hypothetical protein